MATLRHIVAELEKMREEIKDLKEKVNVTVYILREPESSEEDIPSMV